jgi:hypothetical protein
MDKQNLINGVINAVNNPSLLKPVLDAISKSFEINAVNYAVYFCDDPVLVLEILEFLSRAEPQVFQNALNKAIMSCAGFDKLNILLSIISVYPTVDLHFDENLPLQIASQQGSAQIVQFLMTRGANPILADQTQ